MSRNVTYYFPERDEDGWIVGHADIARWLKARGVDFYRCRVEWDGTYRAELQGSEQHERTTNPMG